MKIKLHTLLFFIGMGLAMLSCKKKTTENVVLGYDYFPLETGHYIVYRLDSLYYNDFTGGVDTFTFEVKEKVAEIFNDGAGKPTARIERFYRKTASDTWVIQDVWTANLDNRSAEKTEENQRFVKLVFPAKKNLTWDGNRFNGLGEQLYKIVSIHAPVQINNTAFDSALVVLQKEDSTLIKKEISREIFASHIGMVYKRFIALEDRDSIVDYTKPLSRRVDYGFDYTYTYMTHGKE